MALDERKRIILKTVVNDYIKTAEPVASKALAGKLTLKLSPATLRNEMAELENMGYLEQPHTSAGRVPSPRGYRLYVDELMNIQRLSLDEIEAINVTLKSRLREADRMVSEINRLVSQLTHYAAYMASPSGADCRVRQVELLALDGENCVVVAVFSESSVKSAILNAPPDMEKTRLGSTAEIITAMLYDRTAREITASVAVRISATSGAPPMFISEIIDFVRASAESLDDRKVYVDGATHILSQPEYRDVSKARKLLEYLTDGDIAARLPAPEEDGRVRILIGPENISEELKDSSVAVASYEIGHGMRGFIGVVGPMRMDYSKVASQLGYLTGTLSKLARDSGLSENQLTDRDPPLSSGANNTEQNKKE